MMDKSERRQQQQFQQRFKPRGNPKFLHLLMQMERQRIQLAITKGQHHV